MAERAGGAWSARFAALYALANAGAITAFLPLLTILLPLKVERIAGADKLGVLTTATLLGALAASLSNIAFGALSDRAYAARGTRAPWIAGGLAATVLSYGGIAAASTPAAVIVAVATFQIALNAMLAPLWAVMADVVPDERKGLAAGLLALAGPAAYLVGGSLAALAEGWRFAAVAALVPALVAPLLALGSVKVPPADEPPDRRSVAIGRTDLAFASASRLCVQVAANVLFTYLLFIFQTVDAGDDPLRTAQRVGTATALAQLAGAGAAIGAGLLSDRIGARKPFLVAAAVLTAAGLAVLAAADGWTEALAGYVLFAIGAAVFVNLQTAYVMQILPSPRRHGRGLGFLNLANTLPALLGPALTWMLATAGDFGPVLGWLAALALMGGLLVLPIRGRP